MSRLRTPIVAVVIGEGGSGGALGIAVAEGRIPSQDAPVVDYYPEMMDVEEGSGPKPGRYAFGKDRDVTFRQLIGNTSGYMKPGEEPSKRFHYQTFGMNIITNALATIYGLYDNADPDRLPGCSRLMEGQLRDPIDGTWGHSYGDFEHPPGAKKSILDTR
jgi:CubicO group peptidase (beta-lactamase class C family)